jgi:hypothetical protein
LGVVTADFDGNGQLDFAVVAQSSAGMSRATDPDLSRWIQVVMAVHNGQTWAHLRFRSPTGGLLPRGRYSLFLQNDLLRNALTGASLAAPGGGALTELCW